MPEAAILNLVQGLSDGTGTADIDISGQEFNFVRSIRVFDVQANQREAGSEGDCERSANVRLGSYGTQGDYSDININKDAIVAMSEPETRAQIETALRGTGISVSSVTARVEQGASNAWLEQRWLADDLTKIAESEGLNLERNADLKDAVDRLDEAHVQLGQALERAGVLREDGVVETEVGNEEDYFHDVQQPEQEEFMAKHPELLASPSQVYREDDEGRASEIIDPRRADQIDREVEGIMGRSDGRFTIEEAVAKDFKARYPDMPDHLADGLAASYAASHELNARDQIRPDATNLDRQDNDRGRSPDHSHRCNCEGCTHYCASICVGASNATKLQSATVVLIAACSQASAETCLAPAGVISLTTVPDRAQAQSYQIDCAILLCLSGGWPASVPCARARAEFIRRITPWPVEPPLQIWRCPMGAAYRTDPQMLTADRIYDILFKMEDAPLQSLPNSPASDFDIIPQFAILRQGGGPAARLPEAAILNLVHRWIYRRPFLPLDCQQPKLCLDAPYPRGPAVYFVINRRNRTAFQLQVPRAVNSRINWFRCKCNLNAWHDKADLDLNIFDVSELPGVLGELAGTCNWSLDGSCPK